MIEKLRRKLKLYVIIILIPGLFVIGGNDLQAAPNKKTSVSAKKSSGTKKTKKPKRKKRSYNTNATRQQAINMIRSNSENICGLAGLQPLSGDSTKLNFLDAELYDEGEDIAELEAEDDVAIDIETFKMLWLSYVEDDSEAEYTFGGLKKSEIMQNIMDLLGIPYHFGGRTNRGMDCSAFVQRIFLESAKAMLPRTAREQYTVGMKVQRKNLEFGDLVFFNTRRGVYVSHVGIYLGDNLFAHASSRYGVTVSSLESTYYNKRYIGSVRLSTNDITRFSIVKSGEHTLVTQ